VIEIKSNEIMVKNNTLKGQNQYISTLNKTKLN